MRRRSTYSYAALLIVAAIIGIVVLALRDARSLDGRVMRRLMIHGHEIGAMTPEQLNDVLVDVQNDLETMPIRVATPDGGFSTSGEDVGIKVDVPELRRVALLTNREPGVANRLKGYLRSIFTTTIVDVPVTVSVADTTAVLKVAEGTKRRDPVDPQLKLRKGQYVVLPGSDGEGIDAKRLAQAIELAVHAGARPTVVSARRVPLPSTFTTDELQALAQRATDLTSRPLQYTVNGLPGVLSPEQLRDWLKPAIVDRHVQLTLDEIKTLAGLRTMIGTTIRPMQNARLAINATGGVEEVPSQTGLQCCSAETVSALQKAFNGFEKQPVEIQLEVIKPDVTTQQISSIGVKEPIASFTTRHRPGEARVTNIHRIADLIRGVVIRPGEKFSVNEFVGDRTAEKGFVEAHSISDGVLVDTFGGGISQFATTLFNASFFGGIDIVRYKPHSIYISRYPYGREATLSYPSVDLQLHNNTPYGVMIWPTYTDGSITVTLYSTKWAGADVFDQVKKPHDQCTDVVTTRIRTFPDGTTKKDSFKARYLPGEGVNCDGSPTAGVSTTAPARTLPPRPEPASTRKTTKVAPSDSAATSAETRPPRATAVDNAPSAPSEPSPATPSGPTGSTGSPDEPTATKAAVSASKTTPTRRPKTTAATSPAPDPNPAPSPAPAPKPEPTPAPEPAPAPAPEPGPVSVRPPVTGVG